MRCTRRLTAGRLDVLRRCETLLEEEKDELFDHIDLLTEELAEARNQADTILTGMEKRLKKLERGPDADD